MPTIELSTGEAVVVKFRETDGEVTVAFVPEKLNILTGCREEVARELCGLRHGAGGIVVHVDLADSSGREGVIYHEPFADLDEDGRKQGVVVHNEPAVRFVSQLALSAQGVRRTEHDRIPGEATTGQRFGACTVVCTVADLKDRQFVTWIEMMVTRMVGGAHPKVEVVW